MTIRVVRTPDEFATIAILKGSTTVIFKDKEDSKVFTRYKEKGLAYTDITGLYRESISYFASERAKDDKARMYTLEATALVSENIEVIGNFTLLIGNVKKDD